MEITETKYGYSCKCSRDKFEEIKAAILKGLYEEMDNYKTFRYEIH